MVHYFLGVISFFSFILEEFHCENHSVLGPVNLLNTRVTVLLSIGLQAGDHSGFPQFKKLIQIRDKTGYIEPENRMKGRILKNS